jgi:hypothetical protein
MPNDDSAEVKLQSICACQEHARKPDEGANVGKLTATDDPDVNTGYAGKP